MRENGAHLPVWAGWKRRLIAEQQKVLTRQCISQAAPQGFTACRFDLDYSVTGNISPGGVDLAEQFCRYGGYLKERCVLSHLHIVN